MRLGVQDWTASRGLCFQHLYAKRLAALGTVTMCLPERLLVTGFVGFSGLHRWAMDKS